MAEAFIGLGANLGDPERALRLALAALAAHPRVRVQAVSPFHRTAPVGGPPQPDYLNAVARVSTTLDPTDLLAALKRIERDLGRRPARRWAPRAMDLDILLYDDLVMESDDLVIPHPLMEGRRFVLAPLVEIAPEAAHPVLMKRADELLSALDVRLAADGPKGDAFIAVAGPIGAGKTTLALRLAGRMQLMPLLEQPGRRPLLGRFYEDRRAHALTLQLWFLLRRAGQLLEAAGDRPRRLVSDYVFEKDRLFAALNLSAVESAVYEAARALFAEDVPRPEVVIYLTAPPEDLMRHVRRRGRPGEAAMSDTYLSALHGLYEEHFSGDLGVPVVRITPEMPEWAFARDAAAFRRLLERVVEALPSERWCLDEG